VLLTADEKGILGIEDYGSFSVDLPAGSEKLDGESVERLDFTVVA